MISKHILSKFNLCKLKIKESILKIPSLELNLVTFKKHFNMKKPITESNYNKSLKKSNKWKLILINNLCLLFFPYKQILSEK